MGQSLYFRVSGDLALKVDILQNAERAAELSPNDPNALSFASFASFAMLSVGLAREALRHAQRAVQANPNHGLAYGALALAQVKLGLNEEGIANLDINNRLSPGDLAPRSRKPAAPSLTIRPVSLNSLSKRWTARSQSTQAIAELSSCGLRCAA